MSSMFPNIYDEAWTSAPPGSQAVNPAHGNRESAAVSHSLNYTSTAQGDRHTSLQPTTIHNPDNNLMVDNTPRRQEQIMFDQGGLQQQQVGDRRIPQTHGFVGASSGQGPVTVPGTTNIQGTGMSYSTTGSNNMSGNGGLIHAAPSTGFATAHHLSNNHHYGTAGFTSNNVQNPSAPHGIAAGSLVGDVHQSFLHHHLNIPHTVEEIQSHINSPQQNGTLMFHRMQTINPNQAIGPLLYPWLQELTSMGLTSASRDTLNIALSHFVQDQIDHERAILMHPLSTNESDPLFGTLGGLTAPLHRLPAFSTAFAGSANSPNINGVLNDNTVVPMNSNDTRCRIIKRKRISEEDLKIKERHIKGKAAMCVICFEREVTHVLVPCGHPCLCSSCAQPEYLATLKGKCPVGRCNITMAMKFFGTLVDQKDDDTVKKSVEKNLKPRSKK